ncbi:Putatitive cytidine deaminase [Blumeria hordei DH14]|uniref:Putatitive cytidine deaminase n=1 Tax=Blumeria graminis f. sp. hordei (strain DH14) TaxID=546991 RepID=N1JD61_BLUG1|nr:Putatitive cytidine deaminase [Blumeria hordei DH14]
MLTSRLPTEASGPPVLYVPASHALFHAQYPAITPAVLETLRTRCAAAWTRAYCCYSHFRVGATLLSAAGSYFDGANIENASLPLGICAERVALFTAIFATRGSDGSGPARFIALALAADCETPRRPLPATDWANLMVVCCWTYSLREFCSLDMPILMFNKDGHFLVQSLEQVRASDDGQISPLPTRHERVQQKGEEIGVRMKLTGCTIYLAIALLLWARSTRPSLCVSSRGVIADMIDQTNALVKLAALNPYFVSHLES